MGGVCGLGWWEAVDCVVFCCEFFLECFEGGFDVGPLWSVVLALGFGCGLDGGAGEVEGVEERVVE